jgi:hypothetical protein
VLRFPARTQSPKTLCDMLNQQSAQIEQKHKQMKKLLFKFYGVNFLISLIWYIAYRLFIINTPTNDNNWFDTILNILDIWLNIHFAMIYLIVIVIGSFTFFLNINEKIRNNYLLSLLTFLGIPLFFTIYLLVGSFNDYSISIKNPLATMTMFSMIYLFIITIEFFLFRKKLKNITEKLSI